MVKYFYGKITKSGKKLLINIPYDERNNFIFRSKVKVFLLDIEEVVQNDIVRDVNYEKQDLQIFDASAIIKKFDVHYSFNSKRNAEIIEHAKRLLEENSNGL